MFSFGFTLDDVKRVLWTAAQAFVAVLALGLIDVLNAFRGTGLEGAKAVGLALIGAAIAAAISAVKNLLLADSSPLK